MKTLLELEDHDCRFPFGDGPFLFCGDPAQDNSSWCAGYHAICFKPDHVLQGVVNPRFAALLRKRNIPAAMQEF